MIKLSASLSKKAPIPGVDFSSHHFGAGMEIEVSHDTSPEAITERFHSIYTLLQQAIDYQLTEPSSGRNGQHGSAPTLPAGQNNGGRNGKSNGNGNRSASQPQVKAIFAISRDRGLDRNELIANIKKRFHVSRPDDLSIQDASDLIVELQQMEPRR